MHKQQNELNNAMLHRNSFSATAVGCCPFFIASNVEAMTSKGLRSDELSTDTKLDARYNAE